jgi:hypothetical protein
MHVIEADTIQSTQPWLTAIGIPMKPLLFLANAFINTFGITQPSEEAAERSARFIAVLMGVVILIVAGIAGIAIYMLARQ